MKSMESWSISELKIIRDSLMREIAYVEDHYYQFKMWGIPDLATMEETLVETKRIYARIKDIVALRDLIEDNRKGV